MLDCPGIFLANDIWVCLKLGYTPKIAILIGKIMINRGTHGAICSDKPTWESNSIRSMVLISLPIYKTGSLFAGKCWKTILEVLGPSSNPSDSAVGIHHLPVFQTPFNWFSSLKVYGKSFTNQNWLVVQ